MLTSGYFSLFTLSLCKVDAFRFLLYPGHYPFVLVVCYTIFTPLKSSLVAFEPYRLLFSIEHQVHHPRATTALRILNTTRIAQRRGTTGSGPPRR